MSRYFDALIKFINSTEEWETKLFQSPFSLRSVSRAAYKPSWVMFLYDLRTSDTNLDVVRACRGCVLEIEQGKVVRPICLPYAKFFNMGEHPEDDAQHDWASTVTELKIDGMLMKASKVDGKWFWFTNGSFNLDNELPGRMVEATIERETASLRSVEDFLQYALNKKSRAWLENPGICDGWTLMFELVSPRMGGMCECSETQLYFHGARGPDWKEVDPQVIATQFAHIRLLNGSYSAYLISFIDFSIPVF